MARAKTRTIADINAEIERLKEEAQALQAAEVSEVIGRIKEAITYYGLTAEDLGFVKRLGRKPGRKTATKTAPVPAKNKAKRLSKAVKASGTIKYEDGAGHTWTGRGKRPRWYLDALTAGKSPDDLLVIPDE